ncbi:DegT/DnrJ/EryC1/StrS family aminotransferase [Maritimibacter dapengensis]|uniref:Aminotransferase class I/II-fold pyridoxal phosphate-dependent enzyme n=1 Tax=Maritimibacter dapengensis TaxID=2836868 RepID=A0ABS6T628_9RHOB|nr:aminotransferase class I/II-fold pyridoxal phosphate-dependent enzyme [Maritimibacter dapengensis]MBV7380163.1 aminotransferase class I/II-fold pyridoxal phosphate-dependent enzyme [Maritimibacter dapengensis]
MRIWLSRPHMSGREKAYIDEAFACNFVAPVGPQLNAFEDAVADYLGGNVHCVALASGSAALHLALKLAGVTDGDEVWISSMTFAGGVFPVLYLGAKPVFFDLDPETWTVDVELIRNAFAVAAREGRLPKAIVPTDLYGQSVDLAPLEALAEDYGVKLVVDSAESLGAEYKDGRKCGTGGDIAILSFNGNKIITTSGGGMLVTRSAEIADRARFFATQARDPAPHYEHSAFGFNYRLSNVCAAIGLGQMEVLNDRVERRRKINRRYREALRHPGIRFMPEPDGYNSSFWLTAVSVDPDLCGITREAIRETLLEHDIEARPLWKPMHMQPLFAGSRYIGNMVDEDLFSTGLCLPSGSDMSETEQDEVVGRINALLAAA